MEMRLVFVALYTICSQERNPISGRRTGEGHPFSSICFYSKTHEGVDQKDSKEAKYVGSLKEEAEGTVHGRGPVETVGGEVIHICWLLDSWHAEVWVWLVGHYEKGES